MQYKTETLVDQPEIDAKQKKGKKGAAEDGPRLAVKWHPLSPESGRKIVMHVLEGDWTTASEVWRTLCRPPGGTWLPFSTLRRRGALCFLVTALCRWL